MSIGWPEIVLVIAARFWPLWVGFGCGGVESVRVTAESRREMAERDMEWLERENDRLWQLVKAQQACMQPGRRIVFTDVWAEGNRVRFAILCSDDLQGAEYAANIVCGYIIGMMEATGMEVTERSDAPTPDDEDRG